MQDVLTVRNDFGDLPLLTAWVNRLLEPTAYGERDRFRVELVLTEAVTNIVNCAFPEGGPQKISLVADKTPTRLSIAIIDGGQPFNPLDVPEKVQPASLAQAEPGGLGIVLIRKFCDALSYERTAGRNQLTLVFETATAAGSTR